MLKAPELVADPILTTLVLSKNANSAAERLNVPVASLIATVVAAASGTKLIPPFPVTVLAMAMVLAVRVTTPAPALMVPPVLAKAPPVPAFRLMFALPEERVPLTVRPPASEMLIDPVVVPFRFAIEVRKGAELSALPICPAEVITIPPVVPTVKSVVVFPGLNRFPVPRLSVSNPPFFSVKVLAPVKLKTTVLELP